jgi:uncharacterized protein YqeY
MGLRDSIADGLKAAMKEGDKRRVSTLRLMAAAIKDRDIAARTGGPDAGVGDPQIVEVLSKMVKQRQESLDIYEKAGRGDLAAQEREEIAIIQGFMPKQLTQAEVTDAVLAAIAETGAHSVKDMGKVMAALRSRHSGQMDFAKAGAAVKAALSSSA